MTKEQKEKMESEITILLKNKHSDIRTHIDTFDTKGTINISFFWDRISNQQWQGATSFKCHINDYPKIIETDILPYFE
ncbi:hypothetical protein [uncultured Psychroserpens sp.]|uniref:hypothetical protein n=1 Tax=uncultured Psychroserpens sp. TaxID=255436 RepID=UPI00262339EE|nr:hypothetical protein [uncultured Psychroserpens sp.]